MQWVRSYPRDADKTMLGRRTYVLDGRLDRLITANYDYSDLGLIDDDVLLIEWDVAASLEDMQTFASDAAFEPSRPLAAAHYLYHVDTKPVWAHRRYDGTTGKERWVWTGEHHADLAAFGMIYLPKQLIRQFLAEDAPERGRPAHLSPGSYGDHRFTDQTFSMWAYRRYGPGYFCVDWDVRPVHLHFDMPK